MKAIQISKNGGPEVLELKDIKLNKPEKDEVTIEHKAIGLNYIDTYHRSGLYPLKLPSGIGAEGAGIIKEIKKDSEINLYGIGGPRLEELGFKSEFDFSEINIMGLIQPLMNYRKLTSLRGSLIKLFLEKEIDIFIGIDSPDFNMGIHKALKSNHDNKNIQVVSPSVWGWRQNRVKSINAYIDLTLCLFSFEDNFYKKIGHNSLQLGHPFSTLLARTRFTFFSSFFSGCGSSPSNSCS